VFSPSSATQQVIGSHRNQLGNRVLEPRHLHDRRRGGSTQMIVKHLVVLPTDTRYSNEPAAHRIPAFIWFKRPICRENCRRVWYNNISAPLSAIASPFYVGYRRLRKSACQSRLPTLRRRRYWSLHVARLNRRFIVEDVEVTESCGW
jgi:hypothetical protein